MPAPSKKLKPIFWDAIPLPKLKVGRAAAEWQQCGSGEALGGVVVHLVRVLARTTSHWHERVAWPVCAQGTFWVAENGDGVALPPINFATLEQLFAQVGCTGAERQQERCPRMCPAPPSGRSAAAAANVPAPTLVAL